MNKTIFSIIMITVFLISGCTQYNEDLQEENNINSNIQTPWISPPVEAGNGSVKQFESHRVEATIIDLYVYDEDTSKEMGEIKIDKILMPCGSDSWECKTKLSRGDILDVFFEEGTNLESYCVGGKGPCRVGYSVEEGDQIEALITTNTEDSSYKRHTIFVVRELGT